MAMTVWSITAIDALRKSCSCRYSAPMDDANRLMLHLDNFPQCHAVPTYLCGGIRLT